MFLSVPLIIVALLHFLKHEVASGALASISPPVPETDTASFTYVQYFQAGVESYRQEKWLPCILYFGKAVEDFKVYKKKITSCRRTCHAVEKEGDFLTNSTDVENRFFETAVKHTLCLLRCKKSQLGNRPTTYFPNVDDAFENLLPYDYLQMCYFKAGMVDKALTAAYTFLHSNPGHANMQHNVKFYQEQATNKASEKDLVNLEPKLYQHEFYRGLEAAEGKKYSDVMDHMEKALEAYLEEEEECRAMSEGSFDQDGLQPDLYIALANHLTFALKNRKLCQERLERFNGFNGNGKMRIISRMYQELSGAYEYLDQLEETCKAIASFLLFEPTDEKLLKKRNELSGLADVQSDWFIPRPEAVRYHQKNDTDRKMLDFIERTFAVLNQELQPEKVLAPGEKGSHTGGKKDKGDKSIRADEVNAKSTAPEASSDNVKNTVVTASETEGKSEAF